LIFKKLRHYPPILRKSVKTEFFSAESIINL
jgi:hypothetical protein